MNLPLSLANMAGGNLNFSKILSIALADSSAVLVLKGDVNAKRLKASIITSIYLNPPFSRENFR